MRILLSVLALLLLLPDYSGLPQLQLLRGPAIIHAQRVDLERRRPGLRKIGGLTFLGGVHLTSPASAFGGFSSMAVAGDRFTLVSDGGNIVTFRLDPQWRIHDMGFAELPDGPGTGWDKRHRDSESMAVDPVSGKIWIGFEWANQIWRYAPGFTRAIAHSTPAPMAVWDQNGGIESLARLRDGSFLALSESRWGDRPNSKQGIWFDRDPTGKPLRGFLFTYIPPTGYRPTDMAELPDGRLIVVNRRATLRQGFTAVITVLDRAAIRTRAIVQGQEIARFVSPLIRDNFEAIAAVREGDDTIVWIASDDNGLFLQRSLLLKFRLNA